MYNCNKCGGSVKYVDMSICGNCSCFVCGSCGSGNGNLCPHCYDNLYHLS